MVDQYAHTRRGQDGRDARPCIALGADLDPPAKLARVLKHESSVRSKKIICWGIQQIYPDSDNACSGKFGQLAELRMRRNHGDTLQAAPAAFDGMEHGGIVEFIATWL